MWYMLEDLDHQAPQDPVQNLPSPWKWQMGSVQSMDGWAAGESVFSAQSCRAAALPS